MNGKVIGIAVALLATTAVAGCGSEAERRGSEAVEDRGSRAVEACRGHGGAIAFEDDVVICRDQTTFDRPGIDPERGSRAVDACRGRGGVTAFDDDVVICRDQSFHEAEE
jgi:hypothetical protein